VLDQVSAKRNFGNIFSAGSGALKDAALPVCKIPTTYLKAKVASNKSSAVLALMANYSTVIDYKFAVLDKFLEGLQINLFSPQGMNCSNKVQSALL
jgi:hypothetical protein